MKTVCRVMRVARSNVHRKKGRCSATWHDGRKKKPVDDQDIVVAVKEIASSRPTWGYRRVHAVLRQKLSLPDQPCPVNHKRVYRVMKENNLLLPVHKGKPSRRKHEGKIGMSASNQRWCSDGFEIACDNGEKVQVAFSLDCCDREAISWVGTNAAIDGDMIRDLMVQSVESRFGSLQKLPGTLQWLSDNGSPYIARETKKFAKELGIMPCTTPVRSPQSNGMAEAFVKNIKVDYASVHPCPDAKTVLESLSDWMTDYNTQRPHTALKYKSPTQFRKDMIQAQLTP